MENNGEGMQEDKNQNYVPADIPPPHPIAALSGQDAERLDELDSEVTRRLTSTLDRLQRAKPYQPLTQNRPLNTPADKPPTNDANLTPEQKAAHDAFVAAELSSLLSIAGQLNKAYENQPQAQPDPHFKNYLKQQLLEQARQKKDTQSENK